MNKYRVVEIWADENRLALRCSAGRYHLARCLGVLPAAGLTVVGSGPHLGFGILSCPTHRAVFRVIFESVGNTEMPLPPSAMLGATHRPRHMDRRPHAATD